jgi:hypothetical protein
MLSVLIILIVLLAAAGIGLLLATTVLSVRVVNTRVDASLRIGPVGVYFDGKSKRAGVGLWNRRYYFKPSKPKPKKDKKAQAKEPAETPREKTKLPWATKWQIIKATLIFVGGVLSRVQYEKGQFELEPVMANPALAGMTYGWGQALAGVWPGLGRTVRYTPQYVSGSGRVSGTVVLSVKNRHIAVETMRLLKNLPIQELVTYLFRRKKR